MEFLKSVDSILDYNLVKMIRDEYFLFLPFEYIWAMFDRIIIIDGELHTKESFVAKVRRLIDDMMI